MTIMNNRLENTPNSYDQLIEPQLQELKNDSIFQPISDILNNENKEYTDLLIIGEKYQKTLKDAKIQYGLMLDLFEEMRRIEHGEQKLKIKSKRRTPEDLAIKYFCPHADCQKFYSGESTLQRHIKLKHKSIKTDPPQLYHDLHPSPNLSHNIFESESENQNSKLMNQNMLCAYESNNCKLKK